MLFCQLGDPVYVKRDKNGHNFFGCLVMECEAKTLIIIATRGIEMASTCFTMNIIGIGEISVCRLS